jgi:hypothetical protein
MGNGMKRELGDFQTPVALVAEVLQCLGFRGDRWSRVLEPTCGKGNFISGLLDLDCPPQDIQAIEMNLGYVRQAQAIVPPAATRIIIHHARLFDVNLQTLPWSTAGSLLVVGNPPWVTNAELGSLNSDNLPTKSNFKQLRGLDALTGCANFDLAESIWLKLIRELQAARPTIALLCKTSVARNVLQLAAKDKLPISNASIRLINTQRWFRAAVAACLFTLEVGREASCYDAAVYPDLLAEEPETTIGIMNGEVLPNIHHYRAMDCQTDNKGLIWRQGLKHDAAAVMELRPVTEAVFQNKLGETVAPEAPYLYPLLKGSDVFHGRPPTRSVIVTQKRLGEDTAHLQQDAPRLWQYLTHHHQQFNQRKSSIYQNKPPFSIFGIGDYAFAPYKVGISGLHKVPRFRVIAPVIDRPVMLDDTCYFLPCDSLAQATQYADLLNRPLCLEFLRSRLFLDAKRPITKKLLQSINWHLLKTHWHDQERSS